MKRNVLIIKGYSKTATELLNDRKIIQLYIDFFNSNAGGAFDFDNEILILEEPDIDIINNLTQLNEISYLVIVLIGHGANKNGIQIFQLQENLLIQPGQIQFDCPKQLHIIESCRDVIDFELDIKRINRLIPKYKHGGIVKMPLTRDESIEKFNIAVKNSNNGILYLFACSINESAYEYFFLQVLIDVSIYIHEYFRDTICSAAEIFEHVKLEVSNLTKGKQNPMKSGEVDFPFVISIN